MISAWWCTVRSIDHGSTASITTSWQHGWLNFEALHGWLNFELTTALQESVYIHITHDQQNRAILSYQAEGSSGPSDSKADCIPEVVQRSVLLQELIATSDLEGGTSTTKLPIHPDVFSAWHGFKLDGHDNASVQELCEVLQVCVQHRMSYRYSAACF